VPRSATPQQVADALMAKGMAPYDSHHHMFKKIVDGKTTLVTRLSHGSNEIRGNLVTLMAHQCALQVSEFWQLVECPLSAARWDELVRERCPDGRNPLIGR
jgi:hypothetical protein